jgi:hypothetical protein
MGKNRSIPTLILNYLAVPEVPFGGGGVDDDVGQRDCEERFGEQLRKDR